MADEQIVEQKPMETAPDIQPEVAATAPQTAAAPADSAVDAERRLLVFRRIAAPLMSAIQAGKIDDKPLPLEQKAEQFIGLIDSTIQLNQQISQMLHLQAGSTARWQAAAAAAEIVASHYRATNDVLRGADAAATVKALGAAIEKSAGTIETPRVEPQDGESPLARSLKALAPVASAIARFSFGRDPMELLGDVARRLTTTAADVATKLGAGKEAADTKSPLYFAVLEVAGEFYMESHFTEMDRLLEMDPEERKAYVQAHNRKIPMEPVWERLGLKMGMLEALTVYLPGGAA